MRHETNLLYKTIYLRTYTPQTLKNITAIRNSITSRKTVNF